MSPPQADREARAVIMYESTWGSSLNVSRTWACGGFVGAEWVPVPSDQTKPTPAVELRIAHPASLRYLRYLRMIWRGRRGQASKMSDDFSATCFIHPASDTSVE